MVSFLHLSDIHFHKFSGHSYDLDDSLRNQLVLDIERVAEEIGPPDAILITGDVAFRGAAAEYEFAKKWLSEICDKLGCNFSHVFCVPGNHDIDQTRITQDSMLMSVHREMRAAQQNELDDIIVKHMRDKSAPKVIYGPLTEYNKFAALFGCSISPNKPFWCFDFVLKDSTTLRLWGLNSSLGSDHEDNEYKSVPLGERQIPESIPGIVNLALCHHPLDWWQDGDRTKQGFVANSNIALFGHKHVQAMKREDDSILLTAGAVHPDRREEGWQPRYNWLRVDVENNNENRKLVTVVHPRLWTTGRKFEPDFNLCGGNPFKSYEISLEPFTKVTSTDVSSPSPVAVISRDRGMDPIRILTYRFFELPHLVRRDIARELDLLNDTDEGLQDFELFEKWYNRAEEGGLLADFWDRVQDHHTDNTYNDNPYRKTRS